MINDLDTEDELFFFFFFNYFFHSLVKSSLVIFLCGYVFSFHFGFFVMFKCP